MLNEEEVCRCLNAANQQTFFPVPIPRSPSLQFTTNGNQGLCSDAEHRKGNCDRLWRKNRRKVVSHACCADALRVPPAAWPHVLGLVQHAELLVDSIVQTFRSRCHGVDLNRNWPLDFSGTGKGLAAGAVCDETFHGEGFFSEPEVRGKLVGARPPSCSSSVHAHRSAIISLMNPGLSVCRLWGFASFLLRQLERSRETCAA